MWRTLVAPTTGTWETWVLESANQFRSERLGPDSPARAAEIAEVKDYERATTRPALHRTLVRPQDPAGHQAPDSAPFSSNQAVFYYVPVLHFVELELAQ